MGEGKEYVSRSDELGNIHISEEVLAVIAAAAALEVEGVGGLAANLGTDLAELLGKKTLSRGIRLEVAEENVTVDVNILVKYGHTIPEVGRAVQEAVMSSIEATSGLTVEAVNVNVGGVIFDKETRKPQ
ncbi:MULTISPECIES: Asp23/Gls24 family envelope stress response protein [Intestinimonas]|jgi:uncharacterized alkaline shock family protein YloU|uniref:Asp23/Gls24 family envelope stress response protein n=1 Tax=Intestinimonas massiliensis (ex Afouda et al. 2020) TaxID=1673721 RepID=A0AAW5JR23_9FIRM|nr:MULTISPECIES: Asp23/Gls24 family envelope stress response protein [Intestinimonas]MBS6283109.1 Asp23/Gls24 family envelope stress response protein [Oscillospiraceae bacterium]MDU1324330.1 Asp23/Gls24 family envelope stress response protein [Clostridiales bacterium]CUQ57315.1 alkaline shock protein [Flavonifractor plautii]SCJ27907.1 Protein of uncharacterised function (DUF322) [uncultured Flavonifractor sp.]MCG4527903.1 Asp23/Gls24 family envelope stress response protein [Intestinimonas mass